MIKVIKFLLFIALISFIFVGCQKEEFMTVQMQSVDELAGYKDTNVSNTLKITEIIKNLPGNISFQNCSVESNSININYGKVQGSTLDEKEVKSYWVAYTEKVLLNNSAALLILVNNAETVNINLDIGKKTAFSTNRKELEKFFGRDLNKYANDKELWKNEVIENKVNTKAERTKFFANHKLGS